MTDITSSASHGPLDLKHLEHQTLGDVALRDEVLQMFLAQSKANLAALHRAIETPGIGQSDDWLIAAHSLKGTSRSIGAFTLADIVEKLEPYGRQTIRDCGRAGLEQLNVELTDVHAAINNLLTATSK